MKIRMVALSSCVLGALLLGGCMMDATGSGDEDGLLATAGEQLGDGQLPPADDDLVLGDQGDDPGNPMPDRLQGGTIPSPGDAVTQDYDPNEPHPDPWRVAPPTGPGSKG